MKNQKIINRLGIAWAGIRAAWKTERSFKTQTGFATALLFALLRRVFLHSAATTPSLCTPARRYRVLRPDSAGPACFNNALVKPVTLIFLSQVSD